MHIYATVSQRDRECFLLKRFMHENVVIYLDNITLNDFCDFVNKKVKER